MRPVELVMVGAGNRGYLAYGAFAERNPGEAKFVAVVEPDDARRDRFAAAHRIPHERRFRAWEEIAGRPPLAPGLINATLERTHRASTLALLAAGYEMLLEKPIATTPAECLEIPARCTDGCPIEDECPYFAPRVYLDRLRENPGSFAVAAVTADRTPEGVIRALETGPYGRCVYRSDNDVVDHQVVLMRFAGGLSVSLTMQGSSHIEGRTVRIDGTRATLLANESRAEF